MSLITTKTKSSWSSKINITQFVAFASMLVALFGAEVSPEVQASVVSLIVAGQSVVTWVLRTWFTVNITKASAKKL